jgi:protease I
LYYNNIEVRTMNLADARIAVLAESQYQELELWYPVLRLREERADVVVVAPSTEQVYGSKLGYPVYADVAAADVDVTELDGVIIPGGFAPEGMRRNPAMVQLVRAAHDQGSLVAAICHAGWMLASAGIAHGRVVTCVSVIKDDVISAGGEYVDQPVVRDGNIITSRLPGDLPVFCREIIQYLRDVPERQGAAGRPRLGGVHSSAEYTTPAPITMVARERSSANYGTIAALRESA